MFTRSDIGKPAPDVAEDASRAPERLARLGTKRDWPSLTGIKRTIQCSHGEDLGAIFWDPTIAGFRRENLPTGASEKMANDGFWRVHLVLM